MHPYLEIAWLKPHDVARCKDVLVVKEPSKGHTERDAVARP